MRTENLNQACESFDQFLNQLRYAHSDAINADNQFAEMVLLSLVEDAAELGNRLLKIKTEAK